MRSALAVVVAAAVLGGCGSVPMATADEDAAAKQFTPDAGKANLYVYRGGGVGTAVVKEVILDGRILGSLAQHTFQMVRVAPGKHMLSVSGSENTDQESFEAVAGRNYFYSIGLNPWKGFIMAHAYIEPETEQEGMEQVKKSKRAVSMYAP